MSLLPTGFGSQGGGYEIEQSVRLRSDASAYFDWTPASAGNRKTWTFSAWVKRGKLGTDQGIFSARHATTSAWLNLVFRADNAIAINDYQGSDDIDLRTTQVFRDVGAWYHITLLVDTAQATASDRVKLYVNGDQVTSFSTSTYPPQNYDTYINTTSEHRLGHFFNTTRYVDGYITEVNFIDGTALDADDFGEFNDAGVWIPKAYTGTYGTNGFYLPMTPTTQADGFNAVTYTGNTGTQYVNVGMSPDLIWIKNRNNANSHAIIDTVRGVETAMLSSDRTDAESDYFGVDQNVQNVDASGFELYAAAGYGEINGPYDYVAWCWDAGSASPSSNTDGSITSTVKANVDKGFSIVSWSGSSSAGTIGHGLSSAPEFIITKRRDYTTAWHCYSETLGNTNGLYLNDTAASTGFGPTWNSTSPTSSVFSVGSGDWINQGSMIAYCFHSVSGYSDFGSYTGTGASGNTVTTGFRPAFVMVKKTSATSSWNIYDGVRGVSPPTSHYLSANDSAAENSSYDIISFTDTGFEFNSGGDNDSGATYIYMAFADTRDAAFYFDGSGNKNNWTPNNIDYTSDGSTYDIMLDSPTDNYAVLNGTLGRFNVGADADLNLQSGNLKTVGGNGGTTNALSTFSFNSGKWYAECFVENDAGNPSMGLQYAQNSYGGSHIIYTSGSQIGITVVSGSVFSYTTGDLIGLAVDADAQTVTWYKNGTQQLVSSYSATKDMAFYFQITDNAGVDKFVANFGQQPFAYTPPEGYLPLSTSNLPAPSIADGSEHFNTVLYTGNGSTQSITGVGFQPDLVWQKTRSSARSNYLQDAVRGAQKQLISDSNGVETSFTNGITSFDSDGFSVGSSSWANANNETKVAWNWKANGSGVTNTDGSITSTVSANVDAGFSIVSYTGNGTAGATVGHGLSSAPDMVIWKNRDLAGSAWLVQGTSIGTPSNGDHLTLHTTNQLFTSTDHNNTLGASTLTLDYADAQNGNTDAMIAYCFHSVEGYSKFGSYTGNGSTDGPFVHLGFKPAFVMVKAASVSGYSWAMSDNKRNPFNEADNTLFANVPDSEYTILDKFDLLSNGFKLKSIYGNTAGDTYIYMAFAEHPFGGDSIAPVTAR